MKKLLVLGIIFFSIISIIFLKKDYNHLICTYSFNNNVNINTKYDIFLKNKYVTKVISKETIISSDENILNTYKINLESMYAEYNKIAHYNNEIKLFKNKLVSTTTIDYDKISKAKLVEIDSANKHLFTNDKVYYKNIKKRYEDMGAICKYNIK